MIEKRPLSDMPKEEFEAVVDAYIERETKDTGELDAPLFYEALQEMVAADAAVEEIEVEGKIIDNKLVLDLPKEWEAAEYGGDISILFGERRVAVKLIDEHIQPMAQ